MAFFPSARCGPVRKQRVPVRLELEVLEDRLLLANGITPSPGPQLSGTIGVALSNVTVATFDVIDPSGAPGTKWNSQINWGDGSAPDKRTATAALPSGSFAFLGSHTYAQTGTFTITVMIAVPRSHDPNSNTVSTTAVINPPLQSIAVTPANSSVAKSQTLQFTATGKFTNNSTQDLTSQVSWLSATPAVAAIAAGGLGTGVGIGTSTISAKLNGITGTTVLTVVAATPATQLVISNLAPTSVTAGGTVTFKVTAKSSNGLTATGYTGTVQLTSTDSLAAVGGTGLPSSYTFVAGDNGVHTFTVALKAAGSQTVSVTDQGNNSLAATTAAITVNAAAATHLAVALSAASVTAGSTPVTVTAQDQFNNKATSYFGSIHFTKSDAGFGSTVPADYRFLPGDNGQHVFAAGLTLVTAGIQTVTATDRTTSSINGKATVTITAAAATHFRVTVPGTATTGTSFSFTVAALDKSGFAAAGYAGTVQFGSSDSGAVLPSNATLTGGTGTFTASLKSSGNMTITATDTASSSIAGTSNSMVARGLIVAGFTPTVSGFIATFSKPFDPAKLNLYNSASAGFGPADVTLIGPSPSTLAIRGSLVIDPSNTSFTFLVSAGALPAGDYAVTFRSASNGLTETSGIPLDGDNTGVPGSNYTTTFSVAAAPAVLGLPEFARGPDGATNIKVPNNSSNNIPVTLSGASGVTDVTFNLAYNPALLNITAAVNGSSGGTLTLTLPSGGVASFTFHSATPLSGNLTLGQIVAQVPNSAAGTYKAKALLHLTNVTVNGGGLNAVGRDGLQVVAYLGDTSGDGGYSPLDASFISLAAVGIDTGFAAYPLLDPALVGDFTNGLYPTSTDATIINRILRGTNEPRIPRVPGGLTITPTGPDPAPSLPTSVVAVPGSTVILPVNIDTARPTGSTGMTEAILAVRFDPKIFSVSAVDVELGSLPLAGSGWQIVKAINAQSGEIGIDLFSVTPIQTNAGGSLATIAFHVRDTVQAGSTDLSLLREVNPTGQREFRTMVSDAQGALVLHAVMTAAGTFPGSPGQVTVICPVVAAQASDPAITPGSPGPVTVPQIAVAGNLTSPTFAITEPLGIAGFVAVTEFTRVDVNTPEPDLPIADPSMATLAFQTAIRKPRSENSTDPVSCRRARTDSHATATDLLFGEADLDWLDLSGTLSSVGRLQIFP